MRAILLPLFILASQLANCQTQWRPIGSDDFNQASYGASVDPAGGRTTRLLVKNGNVYSMNVETVDGCCTYKSWYVLGKYSNGRWQHIETPFFITGSSVLSYSFAVDNNETPYLLLNDPLNGNKATVKKFDGTSWANVGGSAVSSTSSNIMEMAIGPDNLPFIIYKEGIVVKVKKFDGTNWASISSSDFQGLTNAVIKMDSSNMPYVLYTYNSGSNYFSMLKKLNGSAWEEIGITDFAGKGTGLCLDSNNQPYILTDTTLRKFNGASWQTISTPSNITNGGVLAIDTDNNLHLAYRTTLGSLSKSLRKLVGSSWQTLLDSNYFGLPTIFIEGNTLYEEHPELTSYYQIVQKQVGSSWVNLGQQSEMPSLLYHDLSISNGVPIVAFKNGANTLSVKEFISGSWSFIGNPITSETTISNTKIQTDSNGITYVAYLSGSTDTSMTVKKRVGANWEAVGPLNFSLAAETKMDFKINHQNVPHVVYKSGRVQKFNGSSWEFVGGSAFTGEKDVQLAFDSSDVPHIIFSSPLVLKRFNGTNWEEVGTTDLAAFPNVKSPQVTFDSQNNLLIGFVDSSGKVRVLKWNGSAWEAFGSAITTNVSFISRNFLKLTVDLNGVPIIMFNKGYNNFRDMVNVYKFNGTDWEIVGNPNFSSAQAEYGNIIFSAENVPIVSYSDPTVRGIYCKFYGEENALSTTDNGQAAINKSLVISPNPVTTTFQLNLSEEIQTVDIFDLTGKKVLSDIGKKDIDISPLQSGLYLVKVKTDTGNYTGKIVKQ
jgi:hypothetical protein